MTSHSIPSKQGKASVATEDESKHSQSLLTNKEETMSVSVANKKKRCLT